MKWYGVPVAFESVGEMRRVKGEVVQGYKDSKGDSGGFVGVHNKLVAERGKVGLGQRVLYLYYQFCV